jgi:hypothetical protein
VDSCDSDGTEAVGLGFTRLLLLLLLEEVFVVVEAVDVLDISLLCRRCDGSHWTKSAFNLPEELRDLTHPNLLLLAGVTRLHDPHQMRMLSLLLGLGAAASRASHIDAVFGHDGEARKSGLGDLLGVLLGCRLLVDSAPAISRRRGHADRSVA